LTTRRIEVSNRDLGNGVSERKTTGVAADGLPPSPASWLMRDEWRRQLGDRIGTGEDWLIARIIAYAKRQGYTRYTSTLEEAWRVSIHDLSAALIDALEAPAERTEFTPDEDFEQDSMSAFAVLEAERHRRRGTDLRMFLGLFKYYRQTYVDWLREAGWTPDLERGAVAFVGRLFDRWEIAFCSAWAPLTENALVGELQDTNRKITNEKNRFLTVTESLGSPVILLDENDRISYVNRAAAPLLELPHRPGTFYYGTGDGDVPVPEWLEELVRGAEHRELNSEQVLELDGSEAVFDAHLRPMLDVSDKFQGTVVVLHDITALHRAELALAERVRHHERMAITDPLTGVLNRRGLQVLADRQVAQALRNGQPLAVLFLDVDDLKVINDRFGHPAGDATLAVMAAALEQSFRVSDIIARVGGDEFVVLLPDRRTDDTATIGERVAANLATGVAAAGLEFDVGFSTGWAELDPTRHRDYDQLIGEADAAMYSIKRGRRARTPG
jgi:diguanylate cyclase (GGDEF)-like protein